MLDNEKCFIIAEAGVNHNGDVNIAKQLIDEAVEAGVDAIKFQTFKAEKLVTKNAPKANYQKNATGEGNQLGMLKKLELSMEDHMVLKKYCSDKNIMFISTPFHKEAVDLLEDIDVPLYKIGSGDLTNIPLLRYVARKNKPIILSTGMGNLGEIEIAIKSIRNEGNNNITLLHCTSNYPTLYKNVHLNSMITIRNAFNLPVGYSDHTIGIEVPIAAVAMGAMVIEKHFTLDNSMEGPDHRASLEPEELKKMVKAIRNIEVALGSYEKKCRDEEKNTKIVARKSIVASKEIRKGEIITEDSITCKRPETGLKPIYIDEIIGRKVTEDILLDEQITFLKLK